MTKLVGKEANKLVKIAITHLEMGSETPQPLPACDVLAGQIHVLSFQKLDSD